MSAAVPLRRRQAGAGVDGYRYTETGNAERLVDLHGDRIRYVPAWRRWLAWDGRRWQLDTDSVRVVELAKDVPRTLLARLGDTSGEARDQLYRWATASEKASTLRNTVDLARSSPGVAIDHHALDAEPWVLNVANGTVDLRTGTLTPHDPGRLLTQLAPVHHQADAAAPQFRAFLERILPDPDVRSYVQRWAGYLLTGDVSEQVLGIWWGVGRNGKSTLLNILRALLGADVGGYSTIAARELLIAQRYEQHPTALASLFRARLATCVELPDGAALDEARIKALTGGDTITARRMREDPWSFTPTHKLVVATNHRPAARADDFALWRRVHLVPFTEVIPPDQVDRTLAERIIDTELPGVLAWALEGCAAWQAGGLQAPDAVRAATEDYRTEADTVGRFLAEVKLEVGPHLKLISANLLSLHEAFCREEAIRPETHWPLVQKRLKELGAEPRRNASARFWVGVGLPHRDADDGV